MAFLGPAEADVAFWLVYDRWASRGLGFPRVPGFPDRAETLGLYEEFASRRLHDIHYFEVWAAYRLALLQFRLDYLLRMDSRRKLGGRPIFLPTVEILNDLLSRAAESD
jgi:aminoglycoside phosphotransferase (APT) family kinase protein